MAKNIFATFGILVVLLLSLGLTSAVASGVFEISDVNSPTSVSEDTVSVSFIFNITYTGDADNVIISFDNSTSNIGTLSILNSTEMNKSDTQTIEGTISGLTGLGGQNLTVYIDAISSTTSRDNETNFTILITDVDTTPTITADTYCEKEGYTEHGDLEIVNFNVDNSGAGKDDEWQYLDEIEITIKVENRNGDDNIEDVESQILILDDKIENGGNDVTNDFDFDDEIQDNIGKLKSDDKEESVFKISELPSDVDEGTYYMYIMTYEDGNEADQCTSDIDGDDYFEFTVESVEYEDSIVAKGAELETQINTYCGQEQLEILVPIYNLGDDSEEKVLVNLYNSGLGIDDYQVINDLDDGDKEVAKFSINIPSELSQNRYDLSVIVSFDWDDDENANDASSYDEENSDTSIRLNILGCKAAAPSVAASLESSAEVGQNLVIKTTIKNNAGANDFVITPMGFEAWADLVSVTPQTASIASDGSQEVVITLSPKQSGAQTFTINTAVDGETYNQAVSVNVAEEPGILSNLNLSGTSLYLVAGIASVLILILLVLLVRVTRRQTKAAF